MNDLGDWRNEIDKLDREVVALLNRRAECVLALAPQKRDQGVPVISPEREMEVLDNVRSSNAGPLADAALARIYRALIQEMRAVQLERDD